MKELIFNEVVVRLDEEQQTVWLNAKQMAQLFGREVRTINEHLSNLVKEGEIGENPTERNFRLVQTEGNRQVEREVVHYNLEAIVAVGMRISSPVGTHFRRWANTHIQQALLGQRQQDRERELWRAYHSAKTGAVQLSVLAALGVPILAAPAAARQVGADEAPAAERIFAALEACWAQLRPADWLRRHEAPGEEPVWWLEPGQVAEELARCWPSARGWTRLAITRALARHPAWRRPQSRQGHPDPKQRFPGRPSPQRYVTLAVAALPPGLRELR